MHDRRLEEFRNIALSPSAPVFHGQEIFEGMKAYRQQQTEAGLITEVFACGTAAVVTPVGQVRGPNDEWTIGDGRPGPLALRLRDELLGTQYGRIPDDLGWTRIVC